MARARNAKTGRYVKTPCPECMRRQEQDALKALEQFNDTIKLAQKSRNRGIRNSTIGVSLIVLALLYTSYRAGWIVVNI